MDLPGAIRSLIAANGNLKLAAERSGQPEDQFLDALTVNYKALQLQIRTAMLVHMFNTFMLTQLAYRECLPDIEPKEMAKAFIGLSNVLANLSKPDSASLDLMEVIMSSLPPEQREAFKLLTQDEPTTNSPAAIS